MNFCIKYQARHRVEKVKAVVGFFSAVVPLIIVEKELFEVFYNPLAFQSILNGHPARRFLDKKAFYQYLSYKMI